MKKTIIIITILLLVGLALFAFYHFVLKSSEKKLDFVITSDLVKPSQDQAEFINSFGYPDVFILSMDDKTRFESWTYYDMERNFTFLDGQFIEAKTISDLGKEFDFPQFRPCQFDYNMTLAQAEQILGEHTAQGEVIPELAENTTIYDYWDQVKVGIKNEKIVFIQTLPMFIPEEYRVKN